MPDIIPQNVDIRKKNPNMCNGTDKRISNLPRCSEFHRYIDNVPVREYFTYFFDYCISNSVICYGYSYHYQRIYPLESLDVETKTCINLVIHSQNLQI